MNDGEFPDIASLSRGAAECVDRICDRFEAAWEAGGTPDLAEYLEGVDERKRPALFSELLAVELGCRARRGRQPGPGEYLMRFAGYPELIAAAFADSALDDPRRAGTGGVGRPSGPDGPGSVPPASPPTPYTRATMPQSTQPGDETPRQLLPADSQVAWLLEMGLLKAPTRPGSLARLDHYDILGEVGAGGMGLVLRAVDRDSGAEVALKLLRPELEINPRVVAQFVKESRHMQRLDHPHILKVIDVSEAARCHYYTMPYVAAGSLGDRIRVGPSLDEATILRIARHVATALAYAHGHGIIHRDLKPSNVLLGEGQEVYLADFGLLRTLDNDSILLLEASHSVGTPPYMSPAVAAGEAEDGRCDIYSLGAVLREMLTGRPPYAGRTPHELLRQVMMTPPEPLRAMQPGAHPGLSRIAEWAMARQLRDRYAQMADVVTDLDRVAEGERPLGPTGRGTDRRWWTPRILAACLLAMMGLGIWACPRTNSVKGPPSPTPGVQILAIAIEHYRPKPAAPNEEPEEDLMGLVNEDPGRPILENDSVLIRARLSMPAYSYVIALHPNGNLQQYYPEGDDVPPPCTNEIVAPAQADAGAGHRVTRALTDGIGLQAFVLLTSDRPLPAYRDWIKGLGPSLPWRPSGQSDDGVWFYDGDQLKQLDTPQPTRGDPRKSRITAPLALAETCKFLSRTAEIKAIRAWAFPVRSATETDRIPVDYAPR